MLALVMVSGCRRVCRLDVVDAVGLVVAFCDGWGVLGLGVVVRFTLVVMVEGRKGDVWVTHVIVSQFGNSIFLFLYTLPLLVRWIRLRVRIMRGWRVCSSC
jgi:hypothetical protein